MESEDGERSWEAKYRSSKVMDLIGIDLRGSNDEWTGSKCEWIGSICEWIGSKWIGLAVALGRID